MKREREVHEREKRVHRYSPRSTGAFSGVRFQLLWGRMCMYVTMRWEVKKPKSMDARRVLVVPLAIILHESNVYRNEEMRS
jgi:hypothetical protein